MYLGKSVSLNQNVIFKIYKVDKLDRARLNREILLLQSLCGSKYIAQLKDVVLEDFQHFPVMVLEFVNTTYYRDLYPQFTPSDVRLYAYQFLQALAFAHERGIMHIDIKPANIVIDHSNRILKLIDWGLARFYYSGKNTHKLMRCSSSLCYVCAIDTSQEYLFWIFRNGFE